MTTCDAQAARPLRRAFLRAPGVDTRRARWYHAVKDVTLVKRWLSWLLTLLLLAALAVAAPSGEILPERRQAYLDAVRDDEYAFLFE